MKQLVNRPSGPAAQRPNGPMAQWPNGPMAQWPNGLASAVLIGAIVVAAVGCDAGSLAATDAAGGSLAIASQEKPAAINVGVVLADRAGYFCVPTEQLGFSAADTPVSAKSSCECIEPRLVQYVGRDGAPRPAILLEYIDESAGSGCKFDPQPMNLGVIITVETASGRTHDFTVNLLHTVFAAAEESSEVLP